MQIAYRPRTAGRQVEINGVTGGHEYATWTEGDTREVGPNETIFFRGADGVIRPTNAISALFNCGMDFVDVATGKNPLFTCACGEPTTADWFTNPMTGEIVFYQDAKGNRQCVGGFLVAHPEWVAHHKSRAQPGADFDAAIAAHAAGLTPPPAAPKRAGAETPVVPPVVLETTGKE